MNPNEIFRHRFAAPAKLRYLFRNRPTGATHLQAILFDMDGVLYQGEQPIPGAAEAVAWCRREKIPHLFLTNTTSRPRRALVEKLADMGIAVSEEELLTPPVAAASWLTHHIHGPVALFVREATREEFSAIEIAADDVTEAAAVVLGDLGEQWSFAAYNRAFQLLMANPATPLVGLGLTRFWQTETGLQLDVGPFIKGLEYASGRKAVVMGKPAAAYFHSALELLGVEPSQAIMIGDDIRGDVEGAQRAGLKGVLVRSGKFRPGDLELGVTPDAILDSVAALPEWWQAPGR